jgi:diguanylate cyclase (GGDEF)-like protein
VAVEHLRPSISRILTARGGEAGLERAQLASPDLILLDVQMPGIDGFETCRRLKADARTRDIPVIFTTVLSSIEDKLSGFEAGGVDYIPKPFQVEELLARVNTHLLLYRLQRDLQCEIGQRRQAELALRKANLELQRLAVLDELTQVANRRRFETYLHQRWSQANGRPLSLLLCDIDYFKQYNDTYGHPAGDRCLRMVAQALSGAVRHADDLLARYGGEEFGVVLPDTDAAGARHVAESLRGVVRRLSLVHACSAAGAYVTLSIGGACATPGPHASPAALVAAADAALYRSKRAGRDRVTFATDRP